MFVPTVCKICEQLFDSTGHDECELCQRIANDPLMKFVVESNDELVK